MRSRMTALGVVVAFAAATSTPALAQRTGKGGTGVDETADLPRCPTPLGVVALVEEKAADTMAELPPGLAALARMAEAQNGGGAKVDPLPLVKLMAAKSGCFRVVDRGGAFSAVERERAMAGGESAKPLVRADYLLSVQVVYSDAKSRESGGGAGGLFGGAVGLKSKTLESQVLISLIDVETGVQEAVASGSARKKDLGVIGGGLLLNLGVGALGGSYASTDIGKVTSLAVYEAFAKVLPDAQRAIAAKNAAEQVQPPVAPAQIQAAEPAPQPVPNQ